MRSFVAITREVDDPDIAAQELTSQIKSGLTLKKHSIGILHYDYEADGEALSGLLHEALGFDIFGGSTAALLEGQAGYHDMACMLTVLTADDCAFQAAVTPALTNENIEESLVAAARGALTALQAEPKLLLVLAPGKSHSSVVFDQHLDALTRAAGGVPVLGGVPASEEGFVESSVASGRSVNESAVLLLLGGNVRPKWAFANVVTPLPGHKSVITESNATSLYRIDGDKTIIDFYASYGIQVSEMQQEGSASFFHKYPLLIEDVVDGEAVGRPYVRMVRSIDLQDGSSVCYASFSKDAAVTLAVLQKEDISQSVALSLPGLFEQMRLETERSGYQYTAIYCASCISRHMSLNPGYSAEGEQIRALLPGGLNFFGFYSYGELCPITEPGEPVRNRMHNGSIVFCAL